VRVDAGDLPSTGFLTRLLRGGVTLSPLEGFLLRSLEQHLPAEMRKVLRVQWRGLNLIQRSPDWQELRFYRLVRGRVDRTDLPKLPVRDGEVRLLSLALRPQPGTPLLHVNYWAVEARFFNLNASSSLRPFSADKEMTIEHVEHSYRSNLVPREPQNGSR
jgi:hypothetical protein